MYERTSLIASPPAPAPRTVKNVPFVELWSGRLQGVVSSGSDIKRVYVAFLEAGSGDYYCCTNNNRPCGGLRGAPCKHIQAMVHEAILQFGAPTVAAYLGLDGAPQKALDMLMARQGDQKKDAPGIVFSRFLNYLRYCELEAKPGTVYAMNWFS